MDLLGVKVTVNVALAPGLMSILVGRVMRTASLGSAMRSVLAATRMTVLPRASVLPLFLIVTGMEVCFAGGDLGGELAEGDLQIDRWRGNLHDAADGEVVVFVGFIELAVGVEECDDVVVRVACRRPGVL